MAPHRYDVTYYFNSTQNNGDLLGFIPNLPWYMTWLFDESYPAQSLTSKKAQMAVSMTGSSSSNVPNLMTGFLMVNMSALLVSTSIHEYRTQVIIFITK